MKIKYLLVTILFALLILATACQKQQPVPVDPIPIDDNQQEFQCTQEQRQAEVCTDEYAPVCGWFNDQIRCITYPCAATYSSPCDACTDSKVAYYTNGECPNPGIQS